MVFPGSVPAIVNRFADEHLRDWKAEEFWVGCSGGFTVEHHLTQYPSVKRIHSNDVILYSDVLGNYFAGTPLDLTHLNPELADGFDWLRPYLEDPADAVAAFMLMAQIGMTMGKGDRDNVPYFRKLRQAHREQFPTLHAKTVEKIRESPLKLSSYTSEDVMTWLDNAPADAAVIAYPPFAGGGPSTYYASDFTGLEKLWEWEAPEYEKLSDERLMELYEKIADRREWMFAVSQPVDGMEQYLRGRSKTTNRATTIYLYASGGPMRLVTPNQSLEPIRVPHLTKGDDLGDDMKLHLLNGSQFQAVRSMFMNPGIRPGSAALPIAVTVGGKLVGVFAYDFGLTSFAKWDSILPGPHVYMMSDFPVSTSDYPKLSKLIVMAALSKEAEQLILRYGKRPFRSMTTTALSNNPVSMKYRGVLTLVKKGKNESLKKAWAKTADISEEDSYMSRPWELQYGSELGRWTLQEALTTWKKKYGDKR
jgi:hypothetical protein